MKKLISFTSFIVILLTLCLSVQPAMAGQGSDLLDKLDLIEEVIRTTNVNSSDDDQPLRRTLKRLFEENPDLFYYLVQEMMSTYDQYSMYLDPGLYDLYFPQGEAYIGIGVVFDANTKLHFVDSFVDNSPALKAGIRKGDQIVSVDGIDVRYMDRAQCTSLIRGEKNKEVVIGVRRKGYPDILEFNVVRRQLSISNIEFSNLGDGVGYIKINRFGSLLDYFIFEEIYSSLSDMGIRSIILDVRGNPGGEVNTVANILNCVIPEAGKDLFELRFRDNKTIKAESTGMGWKAKKIVILTDEGSASASEIFAGSLKAYGYAEIVGTKTYGKGYSQTHIRYEDGSAIIMSVSEIILPVIGSYDGKGITPTHDVVNVETDYRLPGMEPLNRNLPLGPSSSYSPRTLALQQRLGLLGFYYGEPDGVYDNSTIWAVEAFQHFNSVAETGTCDTSTLALIEKKINELKTSKTYMDKQFETAYQIAYNAAKAS